MRCEKVDIFSIDESDVRKINRSARRSAMKKRGGQDLYKPKVEKVKKRYTRKEKYKKSFDVELETE